MALEGLYSHELAPLIIENYPWRVAARRTDGSPPQKFVYLLAMLHPIVRAEKAPHRQVHVKGVGNALKTSIVVVVHGNMIVSKLI